MKKGNVLMVCLGNICRSPLAHGIFKNLSSHSNIIVDSAGTSNYHIGSPPDTRSIKVAKLNNIDISNQQSRQFKKSDFDKFDYIFVMDKENLANVLKLARDDKDRSKVSLLLGDKEVEDPYHDNDKGFEIVFNKIELACKNIINSWE